MFNKDRSERRKEKFLILTVIQSGVIQTEFDIKTIPKWDKQFFQKISDFKIHENYDKNAMKHDIVIVTVEDPFTVGIIQVIPG